MNPRTRGRMIRYDDHVALFLASVRAMRIEISEGARIKFPIESIRFSLSTRDDTFVKWAWRNGTKIVKEKPPTGILSQKPTSLVLAFT
jgi:hypothetical protein